MISYATRSNVAQTSLDAFNSYECKIKPSQSMVYEELKVLQSATNLEVARALMWDINLVTPRMNELVKLGLVVQDCTRSCTISGRKAIAWKTIKRI